LRIVVEFQPKGCLTEPRFSKGYLGSLYKIKLMRRGDQEEKEGIN